MAGWYEGDYFHGLDKTPFDGTVTLDGAMLHHRRLGTQMALRNLQRQWVEHLRARESQGVSLDV